MKRGFLYCALFLFLAGAGYAQKMTVMDTDSHVLMTVNDEGTVGSISLQSGSTPADVTNKLYNQGGSLYWNGSALAAGGSAWNLTGNSGTTAGVNFIGTTDNQALWFRVYGMVLLRLLPGNNVLGGGGDNQISPGVSGAIISGGGGDSYLTCNGITSDNCTIGGGCSNFAGYYNVPFGNGWYATIGGGSNNRAFGRSATVSGGDANWAWGWGNTIPGGLYNVTRGVASLAAGARAHANHDGTFVWGDASVADSVASSGANQFVIRAAGGVHITSGMGILLDAADRPIITRKWDPFTSGTNVNVGRWGMFMESGTLVLGIPNIATRYFQVAKYAEDGTRTGLATVDQSGNMTIAGTLTESSDRNRKENIESVSGKEVLRKLSGITVSAWSYKEDGGIRHMGPMAQDFHAAFGLGQDDTHIATVDADGVALAAIQGLYKKLQDKDAEIADLRARLDALETR